MLDAAAGDAAYPEPDAGALPAADGLPEIAAADVTPELLRAGILRDGCLLVRGLVDRDAALALRRADRPRASPSASAIDAGGRAADGYYEEFRPDARLQPVRGARVDQGRRRRAGRRLAAAELRDARAVPRRRRAAASSTATSASRALISMHKTTLRKASPSVPGAWHQDGTFMGDVRALNLWLSLSRCGDVAPGLDIVPRRLDAARRRRRPTRRCCRSRRRRRKVEEAAGPAGIIRPIFEPGDALFFDELFMHQTASDPSMPNPRFAIESWFFGASGFPEDYAPVAVR